jgi:hypothetical protein
MKGLLGSALGARLGHGRRFTPVRFVFAFFRVNACNRDFAPITGQ